MVNRTRLVWRVWVCSVGEDSLRCKVRVRCLQGLVHHVHVVVEEQWLCRGSSAAAAVVVDDTNGVLRENHLRFELSLDLSRACLGNMIVSHSTM